MNKEQSTMKEQKHHQKSNNSWKKNLDEDLEIPDDFYEKDREEIKNPQLLELLEEYDDIFSKKLTEPSKCDVEHYITLKPDTRPVQSRQFRLSPAHQKVIE